MRSLSHTQQSQYERSPGLQDQENKTLEKMCNLWVNRKLKYGCPNSWEKNLKEKKHHLH